MSARQTTSVGESHYLDRKSLRKVIGQTADFVDLAQHCVCFANGAGGTLLVGIEDEAEAPPADQRVDASLIDHIRKRIGELTINVQVLPELQTHDNGGEYIKLRVPRSLGVASTSDGRYFVRVGDTCRPIVGDDILRLANERPATPWESMTSLGVPRASVEQAKLTRFSAGIRSSDRVNASVKEKSDGELLDHYGLAHRGVLTNLGVLLLGNAVDRMKLGTAPIVQAIKYSVHVTVPRRVVQPGVIRLLADADQRYQLTQRERIVFALLAQTEGLSAIELAERLELDDPLRLRPWLGRLLELGLVEQTGRTKATRYFVPPALLRDAGLDKLTTLTRMQPHRLRALILEDLERFPGSPISEIKRRIGPEIPTRSIKHALDQLADKNAVNATGERRWRRYWLVKPIDNGGVEG